MAQYRKHTRRKEWRRKISRVPGIAIYLFGVYYAGHLSNEYAVGLAATLIIAICCMVWVLRAMLKPRIKKGY
jgi:fatty acid desaturase